MATFNRMTFEKEGDGRWFVVLPDYTGPRNDLEMVAGADKLLDFLSGGASTLAMRVSNDTPLGEKLVLKDVCDPEEGGGAWYKYMDNVDLWLCNVMLFVFSHFPRTVYFDVLTPEEDGL